MKIFHIDILTPLNKDGAINKLREITSDYNSNQKTDDPFFKGKIKKDHANICAISVTKSDAINYTLIFSNSGKKTLIRITNNKQKKMQLVSTLIKTVSLPFGILLLILGLMYFENTLQLIFMVCLALLLILPRFIYKPYLMTLKDFEEDQNIQKLISQFEGEIKHTV